MERFTGIKIGVDRISNHPDNPRKDLGDLSELVASIKDHGILQNITVMPRECLETPKEEQTAANPNDDEFVVLLGHRRLAAYRIANGGWSDIVCNIVWGLSRAEQIGLMMEENAQRNDLTIPEQIESFQLMLDLGENVDSISEKTGFSKSTIYKRVKNADVVDAIKDCSYQLTIADLDELAKVGKEEKEKILKTATTPQSIRQGVDEAIRLEKRTKNIDLVRQQLLDKGLTECVDKNECKWWEMDYVITFSVMKEDISGEIETLTGDEYFEMPNKNIGWQDSVSIRRPSEKDEDEEEETEEEREQREKEEDARERIGKIKETVKTGINDFIKRIILEYGAENIPDADLIEMLAEDDIDISVSAPVAIVNDERTWSVDDEERKDFYSKNKASFKTMAIASLWEDKTWIGTGSGRYDYGDVEKVMELIEKEGYIRPSEEYMEVIKGTSELFDIAEGKE